jgi:hypothetical protein
MREKPRFTSAEEVIRRDFAVKLPSRRYIQLWSTPEIPQFRGCQDTLDESEQRRHTAQVEHLGIRESARAANSPEMPNMEIIGEKLNNQRQAIAAMFQHFTDTHEVNCRQDAGKIAEISPEQRRLANSLAEAANKERIAEAVQTGVRDTVLKHRNQTAELAACEGRVTNNIDQRHFETHNHHHTNNTQMVDMNVHNQLMNMMSTRAQQIGLYMQQRHLNEEQTRRALYETVLHQKQPLHQQNQNQTQTPQNIILHMVPPQPQPLMVTTPCQPPHQPPPPAPGAGAIAVHVPVVPRPAPTIKPPPIIRQQQRRSSSRDPNDPKDKPPGKKASKAKNAVVP